MKSHYLCPVCQAPMSIHEASQGLHCENKHHLDKNEQGYWVFSQAKKPHIDSRQLMRAKRFLLESGVFEPMLAAVRNQLVEALAVSQNGEPLAHLDFDCGEGFFLRSLASALSEHDFECQQTGVGEAENAMFAAAKSHADATYIVSQLKVLPFADNSFDLITLVDKPLKGKELLRVLKPNGFFVQVSPGPRHLWQVKEFLYNGLSEKNGDVSVPKGQHLLSQERISFKLDMSGEDALTLLEMTPYAWRASEKIKRQILAASFAELEIDFFVSVSQKFADEITDK